MARWTWWLKGAGKVAWAPVWVLWRGYLGLWWAYADESRDPPRTQEKAFDVIEPVTAMKPRPEGLLRGGFAGAVAASGAMAFGAAQLASGEVISSSTAWWAWAWGSLAGVVASIIAVRHVDRTRARLEAAGERPSRVKVARESAASAWSSTRRACVTCASSRPVKACGRACLWSAQRAGRVVQQVVSKKKVQAPGA